MPAEVWQPWDDTWAPTGDMIDARHLHTATRLQNGEVLACGGIQATYLDSCELFDPSSGTWSSAPSMAADRAMHSSVMLQRGRVLVIGGFGSSGALSGAELYSGVWSSTGSLNQGRHDFTATLLEDGDVLVTGGNDSGTLASVERYDPSSGIWSTTGSLSDGRWDHMAALLPSGDVVVLGGQGGSTITSVEIFDPGAGTFSAGPSLGAARWNGAAALLEDGRLFVVGGYNFSSFYLASSELYDLATNNWQPATSMTGARLDHSATALGNLEILIAGGRSGSTPTNSAQLYDPLTDIWSSTASMSVARSGHTATLLPSGNVLITGGVDSSSALATAELYDSGLGTWSSAADLSVRRSGHTAALLQEGVVLVAGGIDGATTHDSVEVYSESGDLWTAVGSLSASRSGHTANRLPDGDVIVIGGFDAAGNELATTERFDVDSALWAASGSLSTARSGHTSTLNHGGRVVVAGGYDGAAELNSLEIYNPATETFGAGPPLLAARQNHTATQLVDGWVVYTGGEAGGTPLNSAELGDPATGTMISAGTMTSARSGHQAVLACNRFVLLSGGDSGGGALSTAQLYRREVGNDPASSPHLDVASYAAASGGGLTITGARFRNLPGEASSGATASSASNHPIIRLQSLQTEEVQWLEVSSFDDATISSAALTLSSGHSWITAFVAGRPSQTSRIVATDHCDRPRCAADIQYSSSTSPIEVCGDGDALLEPGEQWAVEIELTNSGGLAATSTVASLFSNPGSGVSIGQVDTNPGFFGPIAASGGTATSSFIFEVDSGAVCVDDIDFDVADIASLRASYADATNAFSAQVGGNIVETGNQLADPFVLSGAPEGGVDFDQDFESVSASAVSLAFSFVYVPNGGNEVDDVELTLVDPSGTNHLVKDFGVPVPASPFDATAFYTGRGVYRLRVRDTGNGSTTISSSSLNVTGVLCDPVAGETSAPSSGEPAALVRDDASASGWYLYFEDLRDALSYDIYEGSLGGSFTDHSCLVADVATTLMGSGDFIGRRRAEITPSLSGDYYLVAGRSCLSSGSLGLDSSGGARAAPVSSCVP